MQLNHRERYPQNRGGRVEAPQKPDLQARYDRTLTLARGSEMSGDKVEAERFYQRADHYRRLLNNQAG
jgi:hypothetical protein